MRRTTRASSTQWSAPLGARAHTSDRAGIDVVFQGESGMISITGRPGDPPQKTATTIGDYVPRPNRHRHRRRAEGVVWAAGSRWRCATLLSRSSRDGTPSTSSTAHQPPRTGTASPYLAPNQVLATADGHLTLAVTSRPPFRHPVRGHRAARSGRRRSPATRNGWRRRPACRRVGSGVPNTPERRLGRTADRRRSACREGANPPRCIRRPSGAPQRDGGGDHRPGRRPGPDHRDASPGRLCPGTGGPPSPKLGEHTAEVLADIGMGEVGGPVLEPPTSPRSTHRGGIDPSSVVIVAPLLRRMGGKRRVTRSIEAFVATRDAVVAG